ncbi:MAG: dihydrodipicolinate synthase family protein [Deltaproteobacteria bacterium]|jgi:4-hydroxy-2-oxoglutarate aldolase|nr:dihydrodipicolinate synthase family protein [Deltaproteobacteria bacterium]
MAKLELNGIFPPIPTPFINEKVAYDKLAANIERWNPAGLKGYVVLGSNGEYVSLSEEEKRAVVDSVVQSAANDMLVIAGTGCESTAETIRLTEDCAKLGADAALVVTPHYYGGRMNDVALIQYFSTVADQSSIPILLYNVPKFTHINMAADLVARLSEHPNIIGLKDSSGNVIQLGEILSAVTRDFFVLVGTASVLFSGLTLGCVGGINALANVAPKQCVAILDQVKKGNLDAARELQLKMLPVNQAVTAVYGVPGLKAAMDMLGYFGGDPRKPLLPSSEREKSEIETILKQADLLN